MISVVIPVLNEEQNIRPLYERLVEVFGEIGSGFEILFVDDGSSDGSAQIVCELNRSDARVKLLSFSRNFGHQIAITAGMDHAIGDAVVIMDADFQHPPELIREFVRFWKEGFEIVYTVRDTYASAGWFKRVTSDVFYRIFRFLSGIDIPRSAADFRLLDRKVVHAFSHIRERARFLRGLTVWVGYKTKAITFRADERRTGRTKYTLRRMLQLGASGILSFSTVPLQIAIYAGFALAAFGFYQAVAALRSWWLNQVMPGWTSTFILLALIGGLQLIVLGVLGIYLGKVYEELKGRPLYLLSACIGIESGLEYLNGRKAQLPAPHQRHDTNP